MLELPLVSNCDNCGACCMAMESPPGYIRLLVSGGDDISESNGYLDRLAS
jgi:hypothetical protein